MFSRRDIGPIANWLWTIERAILIAGIILLCLGVLLSFAASPSVAARIGMHDNFGFVKKHILFAVSSCFIMIILSFLTPAQVRRFCAILLVFSILFLFFTLLWGPEIKGSRRWISIFGFVLQPSEFMKPAFVVICALFFSEQRPDFQRFSFWTAVGLFPLCALLLVLEPDIGQTILISFVWLGLLSLSGISMKVVVFFSSLIAIGVVNAYFFVHHVHERINSFFKGGGNNFQVDTAREAVLHGGWFGVGPGAGIVKRNLPDSHTDFVFSVAAEEYGIILCIIIVCLFAFIVLRSLIIAMKERDLFIRFSIVGLASMMGFQSIINMAVNLHLLPPKGMTLPFISYGGSSMFSIAITMGILLALTRRRLRGEDYNGL